MRWLLDQGVPRSASARLKDWSEDAIHVGDLGMAAASDAAIIAHALSEDRIIVTLDADFHSLIATSGAAKPTVQQSAVRNAFTLLPIIPFVGGLLGVIAILVIAVTINASPTKQGKHDELAGGTQVLKS